MRKVHNIDNIILEVVWKNEKDKMKEEFSIFMKKWPVSFFNKTKETSWESFDDIENRRKYKEYDKNNNTIKKRKKDFFEKIYSDWNYYCPYCWKSLIIHWKKDNDEWIKRLYDIEHFLPRSKYPDLSINLYNWLPSCMACNQRLKWDTNPIENITETEWIFHPYFWFIRNDSYWVPFIDNGINKENIFNNYSFIWSSSNNILTSTHWKTFQLDKIYLESEDTFKIFNFIYSKQWLIIDEFSRFKKNNKSVDDYIDYFFNEYYPKNENEVLMFDNWKFKHDLINNLKDILDTKK